MKSLVNKRILLGVSGGIAAYKSAELVRRLRDAGAEVRVVMTRGAAEFITPLTLQALSGHPVRQALFDGAAEAGMSHIELARWPDAVLVAPASANFLARLAQGLADELLTTLCLATTAPLAVAPAMNQAMWSNPATQANCRLLAERGILLYGPSAGSQACGEVGEGRMLEPDVLAQALAGLFETGQLAGARVLITAGPTREPLDPVRFIGNRSSGRMGYAIAAAAAEAGAQVTLVSGPVALPTPERVARIDVETAEQMHAAVLERAAQCDIFIATAAVADYRPAEALSHKRKKTEADWSVRLQRTPDILADVAAMPVAPFTVGFAAETERLADNALAKYHRKALDMIAANQVGEPGRGFEAEDNALTVYWAEGNRELPLASKPQLARSLIAIIAERYYHKQSTLRTH
jgi:phosphopantothenoylcysteine decarboxylase/phosphopantothenate--cysteine ligase